MFHSTKNIDAAREVWLIGDAFLRAISLKLQAMKTKSAVDRTVKPYIYEYYNVVQMFPGMNSNTRPTVARIYNEFITALNEKPKLPRYIFFVLDREILDYVNYVAFGVNRIITELITWLMKNVDKSIELRKDDMRMKRAVSVSSSGEPRLIFSTMIVRPMIKDTRRGFIFAQAKKYNDILEEVVLKYKHTHIIKPNIFPFDKDLFDNIGNLSALGADKFWRDFNNQVRSFDRCETDLRPDNSRNRTVPVPAKPSYSTSNDRQRNQQK